MKLSRAITKKQSVTVAIKISGNFLPWLCTLVTPPPFFWRKIDGFGNEKVRGGN